MWRKSASDHLLRRGAAVSAPVSDVIKSGWLTKRSVTAPGPFKNWRRCIVLKQHVIIWQHNEDDLRDFAAGGATRALTFGSNVSIVAESHGKRTLCLRISSTYGSLVLEAASADERDAWMDAVARAAAPPAPAVPAAPVLAPAAARAPAPAPGAAASAAAPAAVADDAARRAGVHGGGSHGGDGAARVKVHREKVAAELAAEADALVQGLGTASRRRWSLADVFRSGGASDETALRLDDRGPARGLSRKRGAANGRCLRRRRAAAHRRRRRR